MDLFELFFSLNTSPLPFEHNYLTAAERYEKSARNGHSVAQYNLGLLFEHGNGLKKNYKTATEWYEKAALNGYASAQCNLASLYENVYGR